MTDLERAQCYIDMAAIASKHYRDGYLDKAEECLAVTDCEPDSKATLDAKVLQVVIELRDLVRAYNPDSERFLAPSFALPHDGGSIIVTYNQDGSFTLNPHGSLREQMRTAGY